MPRYVVTWEIDIECATSPRQAAEQAWDSVATQTARRMSVWCLQGMETAKG
jgi:hypothetical protein